MKILHFTNLYGNTSETFVNQYVRKSETFGESIVVSFENVTEEKIYLLPSRSHRRRTLTGLVKYLVDILGSFTKWETRFLEILAQEKPDIIHCHFGTMGVLLNKLLKEEKISIPIVVSFYGYDVSSLPKEDSIYLDQLERLFACNNAFFFGEGPSLCDKIESIGAASKRIFKNPLIVPTVGIPLRKRIEEGSCRFLMIGRFLEKKGFHLALEALGQLKDEIRNFTISIIGFGELEENYRAIVSSYKLDNQVEFLGKRTHDQVREALASHDFFLHPSLTAANGDSEGGAPTILIEAQAAGIPVITSNHADIPYVMGYKDFLSNEGDVESLKGIIMKAIGQKDLEKIISQGIAHVKMQHDFDSTMYEENIQHILVSN